MKIINYREYLSCLRQNYATGQDQNILNYAQDMLSCGKKQHIQKQKLQKEINILTTKINTLREEIKNSSDKKAISKNIKQLKQTKNQLVQKLKQHSQTTRFSTLSNESKAALCTLVTLRKYLTKELSKDNIIICPKDKNGNIFFSTKSFLDSGLHQEARHIKDYISAYIIQNPQKVLNEYHFNKLFGKHSNWLEIQEHIDKFFLAQNKALKNKSRAEIITESNKDIEIIKKYPLQNQVLVRLKTPEALDYEGSAAHNCVGGGSYDKLLQEQNSGIYSLRQIAQDNLLHPIATIEVQKGNITQIQGNCNSIIPYHHCQNCRDSVLFLMNAQDIQSLIKNPNIKENILNRIGIFRYDKKYMDIYNGINTDNIFIPDLRISTQEISDYDWEKITIKQLTITDSITNKNLAELKKFLRVTDLQLKNIAEDITFDISVYKHLQKLSLASKTHSQITLHGQNKHLSKLHISKVILHDTALENFPALTNISFINTDVTKQELNTKAHVQFNNSTITIPMLKQYINIKDGECYTSKIQGNKISGEYLDISDLTESIYLEDLEFVNLKEIKFAPHIKKASFNHLKFPTDTKIAGLKNIEELEIVEHHNILEAINPLQLQKLHYINSNPHTNFDLSVFSNLKELTCPHHVASKIPPSVEELHIDSSSLLYFDSNIMKLRTPEKDDSPLDLRHLHNLKTLRTSGINSNFCTILAPDNIETMRIQTLENIKELDFSNCKKLTTLDLYGLSQHMNKIILPSSIKNIHAPYSDVGFGVITQGGYPRKKIDFILPQNSNKNVIECLQHFWGNECVHLTPTLPIKYNPLLSTRSL